MKHRTPFRWFTRKDIRFLRLAVIAVQRWERTLGTEGQLLNPNNWEVFTRDSGAVTGGVLRAVQDRAWERAARRPDWERIADLHRDAYDRRYNSRAYEARMLRLEVAELSFRLREVERVASITPKVEV